MIPKKSTPIKHDVLIEDFAKGRLTLSQIRVAVFVIRWSWGFDGDKGRRRDWTKPFTKYEIASAINMEYSWCCRTCDRMVQEGKLREKDGRWQFNEHWEEWKVEENSRLRKTQQNVEKNSINVEKNSTQNGEDVQKERHPQIPKESRKKEKESIDDLISKSEKPFILRSPERASKRLVKFGCPHKFVKWMNTMPEETQSRLCRALADELSKHDMNLAESMNWIVQKVREE